MKASLLKLFREQNIRLNSKLTKTSLSYSLIYPIGYCGVDVTTHDAKSLKAAFSHHRVFSLLGQDDWPLYQDFLYSENLVVIGGFRGSCLPRMLVKSRIKRIHVYEPIYEFAKNISMDDKIEVFREAVGEFPGTRPFFVADDYSRFADLERSDVSVASKRIEVIVVDVLTVSTRLSGNWTLFMNCEGVEYEILRNLFSYLDKSKISPPSAIIFQSHRVGEFPLSELYRTREILSSRYTDLLAFDWAWDIWYLKDKLS